jgi:1-acyl-sn-glycerol-3-phosphate acyltransferase
MLCFIGPWSVFWGLLAIFFGALGQKAVCRWILKCWSRGLLAVAGIRIKLLRPPPADAQPCLFFSNHQSALDIPILLATCLPTHDVRFMAKESLFKIPIFGWGMSLTGFIPIRRENARHSAEIFQKMLPRPGSTGVPAGSTAEGGGVAARSYIIFPEGTRSPDGRLQPFKMGALGLAWRMNLPIVPVTLIDACHANPKGKLVVRPGVVRIVFHEPLRVPAGSAHEQRDTLAAQLFSAIRSALPADQQPLTASPA